VLYGDDPRYTIGAVRNAQLLPVVFPGWQLRVYVHRSTSHGKASSLSLLLPTFSSTLTAVPQLVLDRLTDLGAELVYVDAADPSSIAYQLAPMLWRFLIIDDPTVDVFLSRDADSRLSERDAVAVSDWIARWQSSSPAHGGQVKAAEVRHGRDASPPMFHCIRDHPSHGEYPVNGGMWGARRRELASLLGLASASNDGRRNLVANDDAATVRHMLSRYGAEYMDDMRFMEYEIWSRLTTHDQSTVVVTSGQPILCHDSVSCERWPGSVPFPVKRQATEHIGQVFDARSVPRQGDVELLVAAERSRVCEPEPKVMQLNRGVSCVGRSQRTGG
jgi:hypothetical protein